MTINDDDIIQFNQLKSEYESNPIKFLAFGDKVIMLLFYYETLLLKCQSSKIIDGEWHEG